MGGWIWLGVILVTAFLIWRKARQRAGGASRDNDLMARNVTRGYADVESNLRRQGQSGGGGFGGPGT